MNSNEYDERQRFLRYKYGYQGFLFMVILTAVNAFFCEMVYVWADPLVMGVLLLWLPVGYFSLRTVLSDAYVGGGESYARFYSRSLTVCVVLMLICAGGIFTSGHFTLIEDGKATHNVIFLLTFIVTMLTSVIYWVKRSRSKRND